MPDIQIEVRRLVGQLTRERQRLLTELERVEDSLTDAQRMLARYDGAKPDSADRRREPGRAAPPGEARRDALRLMADGNGWTPAKLASARGTSAQAAGNLLKRLMADGLIEPTFSDVPAEFRITALGAGQGLLPLDGSNEGNDE